MYAQNTDSLNNDIPTGSRKHQLFADIGISGSQFHPGLSATYNYKVFKFMGVGAGAHVHHFFPTITHPAQYVPAIYGDVRFTIFPRKKNQLFLYIDAGINFYSSSYYTVIEDNILYTDNSTSGSYSGIGIGFYHQFFKKDRGIYWTLTTISNSYSSDAIDLNTGEKYKAQSGRGTILLSCGIRL